MRDYIVISDSTADLPIAVVKELEVPIVPFSYSIEEQVYEYYLDERDGDIGSFYERLRKGAMPVTSQINPAMYQDFFEPYVKEGKDVFIHQFFFWLKWFVSVFYAWRGYGAGQIPGSKDRMCGFPVSRCGTGGVSV